MLFMKRLTIISLVIVTIFTFVGCGTESNSSSNTSTTVTTTVDSVKSNKYYNDIDSTIQTIVKAYKTKSFNERAAMYPDYFIKGEYGGNAGLKEAIKGFYTCDTEYKINSIKDMTDKYAEKCIKEIKDYYDIDVNIEKVVLANVSYKYTNYSDKRLDDSELVPTDEYYISIDGKWYYGWGLEINSEVSEQVVK